MSKQILIDSYFGLVRTAISEGSSLLDYYEESPEQGRSKGNIYRGVVKRIDAPIQAAFVRYGAGRDGFLPLRDVGAESKAPKVGEAVLVQVVKDEIDHKGAALTTRISLSGRYLVYMPGGESQGGISSRIMDEERSALKKVMGELQIPEEGSVILRTAALNKGVQELQADLDRLTEIHREITEQLSRSREPGLLFQEAPPALRYLREYYSPDVGRIWVNQEEVLEQCRQFFYLYEPKSASKVVLSQDGPLMFQKLGLEAEVERLTARKVGLPSGANIVIDQAEALVAIDVNSAKAGGRGEESKGKGNKGRGSKERGERGRPDLEGTAFAVNREAAVEIARQLRLRDLGGIIIVDFIDMEEERHRRQIEETMRKALAADKAKVKVFDISPLGIMQISRQRLRKAGPNFSKQGCEACQGRGWHPSPAAGALTLLRKIEERLIGKRPGQAFTVSAPYPVANILLNDFREHLHSMESRFACTLRVSALPVASGDAVFSSPSTQAEGGKVREPAKNREAAEPKARSRGDRGRGQEGRTPRGSTPEVSESPVQAPGRHGKSDEGAMPQRSRGRGEVRPDRAADIRLHERNEGRNEGRRGRRPDGRGSRDNGAPIGGGDRARLIAEGIIRAADGSDEVNSMGRPTSHQIKSPPLDPAGVQPPTGSGSDRIPNPAQSEIVRVAMEQARKMSQGYLDAGAIPTAPPGELPAKEDAIAVAPAAGRANGIAVRSKKPKPSESVSNGAVERAPIEEGGSGIRTGGGRTTRAVKSPAREKPIRKGAKTQTSDIPVEKARRGNKVTVPSKDSSRIGPEGTERSPSRRPRAKSARSVSDSGNTRANPAEKPATRKTY